MRDERPELVRFSKLNLNRYFHLPAAGEADPLTDWNENAVLQRGENLFSSASEIWPYTSAAVG